MPVLFVLAIIGSIYFAYLWLKAEKRCAQKQQNYNTLEADLKQQYETHYGTLFEAQVALMRENFEPQNLAAIEEIARYKGYNAAVAWMQEQLIESGRRLQQELVGDVTEEAERLATDGFFAIRDPLWRCFQGFKLTFDKSKAEQHSTCVFPQGTRMALTRGENSIILIEQPPAVRSTLFTESAAENGEGTKGIETKSGNYVFRLAYPYVYYLFTVKTPTGNPSYISTFSVYLSNTPIMKTDDKLYRLPLPNVEESSDFTYMCLNFSPSSVVRDTPHLSEQCRVLIEEFWNRPFGSHGDHKHLEIKGLKSLDNWQRKSEKNPLFVCDIDWKDGKTLKGLIERTIGQGRNDGVLDEAEQAMKAQLEQISQEFVARVKISTESVLNASWIEEKLKEGAPDGLKGVISEHADRVFTECANVKA